MSTRIASARSLRRRAGVVAALVVALVATAFSGLAAQDADDDPAATAAERAEILVRSIQAIVDDPHARPSIASEIDLRYARKAERDLVAALRGPVDVTLVDQELDVALDLLRKLSGASIVVSKKARESLATEKPVISLELVELPLENVLELFLLQLGDYRFVTRYGALILVRSDEYRPRQVLKLYNVSDLLRVPRDFRAPRLGLQGLEESEG